MDRSQPQSGDMCFCARRLPFRLTGIKEPISPYLRTQPIGRILPCLSTNWSACITRKLGKKGGDDGPYDVRWLRSHNQ
jgi:hypothetical protein